MVYSLAFIVIYNILRMDDYDYCSIPQQVLEQECGVLRVIGIDEIKNNWVLCYLSSAGVEFCARLYKPANMTLDEFSTFLEDSNTIRYETIRYMSALNNM